MPGKGGPANATSPAHLSTRNPRTQSLPARKKASSRAQAESPKTPSARLVESLDSAPLDPSQFIENVARTAIATTQTVLYLAYGSNLCRKTFRKQRGIKPVSQVNVTVPELVMIFDLPGIPYTEPCFGNTRKRQFTVSEELRSSEKEPYHKDRWRKGLVGVVYEVTLADYAHIIATEGGGASYQDVLVDCYALPDDASIEVPVVPSGTPFKAHTLLAPTARTPKGSRLGRPDPSYAQPSPRYLKLITDGAGELALPLEYRRYLHSIRTYRITTTSQRLGQWLVLSIWGPPFVFVLALSRLFADEKGQYSHWLTSLVGSLHGAMWSSYDCFFARLFRDGERTIGVGEVGPLANEKEPLLAEGRPSISPNAVGDRVLQYLGT